MTEVNNLINWTEVSRVLTSNPKQIRSDYSGKKYARQVNGLKRLIEFWVRWQKIKTKRTDSD